MKITTFKSLKMAGAAYALAVAMPANAALMGMWEADGWSQLAAEDTSDSDGRYGWVGPAYGGQAFDAEYLYYKHNKVDNVLSIGLQSGFDLNDGVLEFVDGNTYYAGDLALGFNGGDFNYAVDFGFVTKDRSGNNVGLGTGNQDTAGLYQVDVWNNNITQVISSPFAMDDGSFLSSITNEGGVEGASFYRIVSFDLDDLGFEIDSFTAHWTMSCGNDMLEGSANVPEPSPVALLLGGLIALIGGRKMSRSAKI